MAVRRTSARLSGGSTDDSISPKQSRSTTQLNGDNPKKRKAALGEDDKSHKKRKDAPLRAPKQAILKPGNRFQVPGGLIITPAPNPSSTLGPASQNASESQPRRTTRPASPTSSRPPPQPKRPPASRSNSSQQLTLGFAAPSSIQFTSKGKERARIPEPQEIVEDVRAMRAELDDLTRIEQEDARKLVASTSTTRNQSSRISHSNSSLQISLSFPAPRPTISSTRLLPRPTPLSSHDTSDLTVPLPIHDTPMINKNIEMRKEAMERRRSSLGSRGRRVSSLGGLATSLPHPSVPTTSLYKHIAGDLPEPVRARHLLVWCAARSRQLPTPKSSSSRSTSSKPTPDLPPTLQPFLKSFQDDFLKSLASGDVDIPLYSPKDATDNGSNLREHEQNAKNRKREEEWLAWMERCKAEDATWSQLIQSYNTHQANVFASISAKLQVGSSSVVGASTPSRKGKSRASRVLPEGDWLRELEQDSRWSNAVALTKVEGKRRAVAGLLEPADTEALVDSDTESEDGKQLTERLQGLELKVDTLHSLAHSASEMTNRSDAHLTHFLSELSSRLRTRTSSTRPASSSSTSLTSLMSHQVTSASSSHPTRERDPRDLLRALSYTDSAAPAKQRGDAVRRVAKEVKAGAGERKVTATPRRLPAGTPAGRKPPGTPRTSRKG